jgi:ABC-2 type transport system ATP-binding protein
MIEVENLVKRYRDIVAVNGVTFAVDKGEILGFLGPNGAGKTTTMRILTGYIPATSGRARVAGFDVVDAPRDVRRRVGYLPETPPLYGEMVVRDYLRYVARLKGVPRRSVATEIGRVAERTGLTDVLHRVVENLSRGYRQRVGLAQALLGNPEVVILDEPTVGLDPNQIAEVRTLIKEMASEHTVILSTHILAEVQMTCSRVVIIHEGRVVAADRLDRLLEGQKAANRVRVRVLRPDGVAESLSDLTGVSVVAGADGAAPGVFVVEGAPGHDIREQVAQRLVMAGAGLVEMVSLVPNLEDVFRKLTTDPAAADAAAPAREAA